MQQNILVVLPAPLESVMKVILRMNFLHSRRARWFLVGGKMYTFQVGCTLPSPVPMSSFLTRSRRCTVMDFRRYLMASSSFVIIAGRLSRYLTSILFIILVVSELSSELKRVFAIVFATSDSVWRSDSSKKKNPLRLVTNAEGGGRRG